MEESAFGWLAMCKIVLTIGCELSMHTMKGAMSLEYGAEIGEVEGKEKLECGHAIEDETNGQYDAEVAGREILVEQEEIITEVEKGFARIALCKGCSSEMIGSALRDADEGVTVGTESPTEVDFLLMGKETAIEATNFPIGSTGDEQGCACSPMDGYDGVILAVVGFYMIEDASATEGIAKAVDVTACGSCVLEVVGLSQGEEFGLAGSHVGMLLHVAEHGLQPVGLTDFHIAIEQEVVVGIHSTEGLIVTLGESIVLGERDDGYGGKLGVQYLEGVVGGGIVGHKDLHAFFL